MHPLPPAFVVSADSARLAQFRAAWTAVGLPADAVAEWRACVIPGEGSLGNAVAQYALVRHALASGLPAVLVFEDDAVPADTAAEDLPREIADATARGDAAIRLGWIPFADGAPRDGKEVLGSQAYAILSPDAMRDYCEAWTHQGKADVVFSYMSGRVSCASRNLFLQHVPAGTETRAIHGPRGWKADWHLRTMRAEYEAAYAKSRAVCDKKPEATP
jgi:hypothetical protein